MKEGVAWAAYLAGSGCVSVGKFVVVFGKWIACYHACARVCRKFISVSCVSSHSSGRRSARLLSTPFTGTTCLVVSQPSRNSLSLIQDLCLADMTLKSCRDHAIQEHDLKYLRCDALDVLSYLLLTKYPPDPASPSDPSRSAPGPPDHRPPALQSYACA